MTFLIRLITKNLLLFLTFFLSLGASLRARMTKADADGNTAIVAALFCTVSCTVILKPFQSPVDLAMSSEIFLGAYSYCIKKCLPKKREKNKQNNSFFKLTKPSGPIFGARAAVAAPSPPVTLRITLCTAVGSNFGGILFNGLV